MELDQATTRNSWSLTTGEIYGNWVAFGTAKSILCYGPQSVFMVEVIFPNCSEFYGMKPDLKYLVMFVTQCAGYKQYPEDDVCDLIMITWKYGL